MRIKKIFFLIIFLLIFTQSYAADTFTADRDYKVIPNPPANTIPKNKVLVQEFFSYGCPWCFQLEPSLEKWLAQQPKYVSFDRIPVVFEQNWQMYAKAYYIADAYKILPKFTPAIFKAIHVQNLQFSTPEEMAAFFQQFGVSKTQVQNALTNSLALDLQLKQGVSLMQAYQVFEVPTFVINGRYKTNAMMTNGDDKKLLQVVSYLIKISYQQKN